MPSFTSQYVEPGVYIKIENVPAPNVTGGNFIPIFVGLGRKDYDISGAITRTNLDTDLITDEYTVVKILSISDSNNIIYTKNVDYKLYETGGAYYVDWNQPQSIQNDIDGSSGYNVDSKTLKLSIKVPNDSKYEFTTTFSGTDPIAIADVISDINSAYQTASGTTDTPVSQVTVDGKDYIKITGDYVIVEGGTALADLGFIQGQYAESKEPSEGDTYTIIYKRLKLSTEYQPKLFSRLEDVYAEWGPYAIPTELVSSTAHSSGNTTTNVKIGPSSTTPDFSGTADTGTTDSIIAVSGSSPDLSNVNVGDYLKMTSGAQIDEIKIVSAVDDTTNKITLLSALSGAPSSGDTFEVYPKTDLSNVEIGHYLKITDGVGEGQIRVIMAVDAEKNDITVAPALDESANDTSKLSIKDGPESEISIAATIAQNHGAVNFLGSQSPDDIVDDNNLRKAVDNTKEKTNGFQGWCLNYLKGVDENDSIVSYIKSYVAEMNGITTKQERMALFGVKASISNYQDVVNLTKGIKDARVGVVANPFARITGVGKLDGSYIASAITGLITNPNFDPGEPISGKALLFDYIDDPYLRQEKRQLGQYGSIVTEKQGVDYNIIHYLSTKTDDVIDSELKVIKQIDDLKKTLRNTLSSTLTNIRISNGGRNILSIADSFMNLILSEKVKLGAIAGFDNIEIKFNENDPRQLDVKFLFRPTFDLNWISITFGASIQ